MKRTLHLTILLAWAFALPSVANAQHPLTAYLERLLLVRAKVDSIVGVQHGRSVSRQVIRQVYCGSGVSEGDTFVAASIIGNSGDSIGYTISPTLELNEEGIWLLVIKGDVLGRQQFGGWGVEYPARQREPARFDEARLLAEEVRSVWNLANESERLERVLRLAEAGSGEAQLWAIAALAGTYPDRLRGLVKANARNQAWGMRVLMVVDQALCDAEEVPGDWQMSDDRSTFLDSIALKVQSDDRDILPIIVYVRAALQRRLMSCGQAAKLVRSAAVNEQASIETVLAAVDVLRIVVGEEQCKEATVDIVCEILESRQERKLRSAAISVLRTIHQISRVQGERLERIVSGMAQTAKGMSPESREAIESQAERELLLEVLKASDVSK